MKNSSISLFRQILDLVPKHEFEKIIMKLRVEFNNCDGGLITRDGKFPLGFYVASENGEYCAAKAEIAGNCVLLRSCEVKDPIYVRYGWADNPEINLVNGIGLPASPFEALVE